MIKQFSNVSVWSNDLNNLLPFYRDVLGLKIRILLISAAAVLGACTGEEEPPGADAETV